MNIVLTTSILLNILFFICCVVLCFALNKELEIISYFQKQIKKLLQKISDLEQAKKEPKNEKEIDLQNLIYKQLNSCILSNDYDKINMLLETLKTIR